MAMNAEESHHRKGLRQQRSCLTEGSRVSHELDEVLWKMDTKKRLYLG